MVLCHCDICTCRRVTMWSQLWSSYIGCRLSKELHTSCVCSCITSTLDKHHSTCQTVYPQFLHSVADAGWGRITFCQDQELDLENEVSLTVAQPPGTLFLPTSTTLLTPVHSENDSRVYFMIVLLDVSYSGALQISRWLTLIDIKKRRRTTLWNAERFSPDRSYMISDHN